MIELIDNNHQEEMIKSLIKLYGYINDDIIKEINKLILLYPANNKNFADAIDIICKNIKVFDQRIILHCIGILSLYGYNGVNSGKIICKYIYYVRNNMNSATMIIKKYDKNQENIIQGVIALQGMSGSEIFYYFEKRIGSAIIKIQADKEKN